MNLDKLKELGAVKEVIAVPEPQRTHFLPSFYPGNFLQAQNTIYNIAQHLLRDYKGGYWEFVIILTVDNQSIPFMYPRTDSEALHIANPLSHREGGEVSALLASLIVNSFALSHLSFAMYEKDMDTNNVSTYYMMLNQIATELASNEGQEALNIMYEVTD